MLTVVKLQYHCEGEINKVIGDLEKETRIFLSQTSRAFIADLMSDLRSRKESCLRNRIIMGSVGTGKVRVIR